MSVRKLIRSGRSQGLSLAGFDCTRYFVRMDSREALVALNLIEGVGPIRVRQLLEHFGDAVSILRASSSQLNQVKGIGPDTAEAISKWERTIELGAELKRIQDFGCKIVISDDTEYPELLRQIYDPPIVHCVPI